MAKMLYGTEAAVDYGRIPTYAYDDHVVAYS